MNVDTGQFAALRDQWDLVAARQRDTHVVLCEMYEFLREAGAPDPSTVRPPLRVLPGGRAPGRHARPRGQLRSLPGGRA
jgi:hypothetical protein